MGWLNEVLQYIFGNGREQDTVHNGNHYAPNAKPPKPEKVGRESINSNFQGSPSSCVVECSYKPPLTASIPEPLNAKPPKPKRVGLESINSNFQGSPSSFVVKYSNAPPLTASSPEPPNAKPPKPEKVGLESINSNIQGSPSSFVVKCSNEPPLTASIPEPPKPKKLVLKEIYWSPYPFDPNLHKSYSSCGYCSTGPPPSSLSFQAKSFDTTKKESTIQNPVTEPQELSQTTKGFGLKCNANVIEEKKLISLSTKLASHEYPNESSSSSVKLPETTPSPQHDHSVGGGIKNKILTPIKLKSPFERPQTLPQESSPTSHGLNSGANVIEGKTSVGSFTKVPTQEGVHLTPPSSSIQHNSLVGGGINSKSLDSIKQEFVKSTFSKPQQVSQTPKSPAQSPFLSVNRSNSIDKWIEDTNQETIKRALDKAKKVSQTPSAAQSPLHPFVAQSNSIDETVYGYRQSWSTKKQEPVKRWVENPKQAFKSPTTTTPSPLYSSVNEGNSFTAASSTGHKRNRKPSPSLPNAHPSSISSGKLLYSPKPPPLYPLGQPSSPSTSDSISSGKSLSSSKPCPVDPLGQPSSPSTSDVATEAKYVRVEKKTTSLYAIPADIKQLIMKDIVPPVLRRGLTLSTYRDYFAALLYAEDFYIEKWNAFCIEDVTIELQKASIYTKSNKNKQMIENDEDERFFVAFEMDSIPERRPFLLSRDFVLLKPSGKKVKPFQGILYRVVKRNLVLADFEDDFHLQHSPHHKYDVSFSFNRVCLKRAHQAVAEINDTLLNNFLFPSHASRDSFLDPSWSIIASHQNPNKIDPTAVCTVSMLNTPPPYLVEGPLSVYVTRTRLDNGATIVDGKPTKTGLFIKEAVIAICRTSPNCRILINAPTNITCDVLMRSLREKIPESDMFRANAAFRERCDVLDDILPLCPFEGECFTCPLREELRNYQVVLSTYVSSYRLYKEGISAGHFTHIFLVDASSTTEPETMVALGNLADEKTVVVVSGSIRNSSNWVRSDIGRKHGLKMSYFQRLFESEPWCSGDPMFVTRIQ